MVFFEKILEKKLSIVLPELNEKQRRILIAAEAMAIGYGGISKLSHITGVSRTTIHLGINEIKSGKKSSDRIRKKGAGRKKVVDKTPHIKTLIEDIVEPDVRGDPECPLRWTSKSVRNISHMLTERGCDVGRQTVASLLHEWGFSLQGNRKTKEGKDHPDRDKQFRYIHKTVKEYVLNKLPVISVDTKKKELVGNYKNNGQEWRRKGNPIDVNGHDFPNPEVPKAIPYGVYDLTYNKGWVSVGVTSDTAEFAVSSIRTWWTTIGHKKYPNSNKFLICADAGGSNSYRSHLWKREIQRFCNDKNIEISVCHFPPGTSKWNKIEHRLFSFISMNWRGKPLLTYKVIIDLIASTKTKTGLVVQSYIDNRQYKKGLKVTKKEIENFNIFPNKFQGAWNYTIKPKLNYKQ